MKVALRGKYIEFVLFSGITEKYPRWFRKEIDRNIYLDESRYTFWIPLGDRKPDYYEKQLVEDYSVFLRKPDGDIHLTDYDVFQELYISFKYNAFTNSGIAAFEEDCIEYVECRPETILTNEYPAWFYEYFTEAIHLPQDEGSIFLYDTDVHCLSSKKGSLVVKHNGDVTVDTHCVFLRNKFGEIRSLTYDEFLKYYDPNPTLGGKI